MSAANRPPRRLVALAACAALASACAALKAPPHATAALRDSAPVIAPGTSAEAAWPSAQWWRDYHDPLLDELVERAIGTAPGIASADARIREAQQQVRVAGAALGLQVDASAEYRRQRLSDNGMLPPEFLGFHWYDQADLGLSLRYQFDWWGKQRAAMEAAIDQARARAAERQAASLALAGAVCEAYFGWQAASARIALLDQAIVLVQRSEQLAQRRAAAELEAADNRIALQKRLAGLRDDLAALQGARQLHQVELGALLGVDAATLPVLVARPLPQAAQSLPADAGTNLLARRPDITASRWRVEAALAGTEGARAAFYPDVSLHALAALSSIELGNLFESGSRAPMIGAAIDLPLFDAGLRRARHGAAEAALAAAVAAYDDAVVSAAREAGRAAAAVEQAAAQRRAREQQLAAARAQLTLATTRVSSGLTHIGPQLEADVQQLVEQDALLQIHHAALRADVQLKQALGGSPVATKDSES